MMLDGTLCSECGAYIGTDNGYPTLCPGCAVEHRNDEQNVPQRGGIKCPLCGGTSKDFVVHAKKKHPKRWRECLRKAGVAVKEMT